jgi:hypothetical protein
MSFALRWRLGWWGVTVRVKQESLLPGLLM